MKQIPLTQGKIALVDDADYGWLNQWKWSASKTPKGYWYVQRGIMQNGKLRKIIMHREILGLKFGDKKFTDHKNHNTLDNQRENLRACSNAENCRNQEKIKNCSSKYKGVCWLKKVRKWWAYIYFNYKSIYLGRFSDEKEAALTYNRAAIKYFGEYAKLNVI